MLYGLIIPFPKNWRFKQFRGSETGRKVSLPRLWARDRINPLTGAAQKVSQTEPLLPAPPHPPCRTHDRKSAQGGLMVAKPLQKRSKPWDAAARSCHAWTAGAADRCELGRMGQGWVFTCPCPGWTHGRDAPSASVTPHVPLTRHKHKPRSFLRAHLQPPLAPSLTCK